MDRMTDEALTWLCNRSRVQDGLPDHKVKSFGQEIRASWQEVKELKAENDLFIARNKVAYEQIKTLKARINELEVLVDEKNSGIDDVIKIIKESSI